MSDIHGTREELVAMLVEQRAKAERFRAALKQITKMDGHNDLTDAQHVAENILEDE